MLVEKKISKQLIIFMTIYNVMIIFYTQVPSIIVMFISIVVFGSCIHQLKKQYGLFDALCYTSLLAIPTSFISILGTTYGELPVTWFNLMIIGMCLYIFKRGIINKRYFLLLFSFLIFAIISLVFVKDVVDALKQILTIVIFLVSFIIGEYLKKKKSINAGTNMMQIYIYNTIAFSIQILIQVSYVTYTGTIVGTYGRYGLGRVAYAGTMGDFSFASLYLASGALLILLLFIETKKLSMLKLIVLEGLHLVAILLTSARTGLYALIITVALYMVFDIVRKGKVKIHFMLIICIAAFLVPYLLQMLLESRGYQELFDGSGRYEGYVLAIERIATNLFFGIGFGLQNAVRITGDIIPHNFFVQYLLQAGVIGTILITLNFYYFVKRDFLHVDWIKWMFVLVAIGAMVIPDIFSSRFLYAVVLMVMVCNKRCRG